MGVPIYPKVEPFSRIFNLTIATPIKNFDAEESPWKCPFSETKLAMV